MRGSFHDRLQPCSLVLQGHECLVEFDDEVMLSVARNSANHIGNNLDGCA